MNDEIETRSPTNVTNLRRWKILKISSPSSQQKAVA